MGLWADCGGKSKITIFEYNYLTSVFFVRSKPNPVSYTIHYGLYESPNKLKSYFHVLLWVEPEC